MRMDVRIDGSVVRELASGVRMAFAEGIVE